MLPSQFERHVVVLRDGCEGQLDQEAQPANHFVLMLDFRCAVVVGHECLLRVNLVRFHYIIEASSGHRQKPRACFDCVGMPTFTAQ